MAINTDKLFEVFKSHREWLRTPEGRAENQKVWDEIDAKRKMRGEPSLFDAYVKVFRSSGA